MNNNITELVFILDRSGSMHGLEGDTIGGFNSLIEKQRKAEGRCFVTAVLFNDKCKTVCDRTELADVFPMTEEDYTVGGCTALLDALGGTIRHIARIHHYARQEDVPEHTVFVIMTDGLENASRHYTGDQVRRMIEHEKEKYGWEFLFLGANIDAVETASHYGIGADRAVNFHNDKAGQALNYKVVSEAVCTLRSHAPIRDDWKEEIEEDFKSRKSSR